MSSSWSLYLRHSLKIYAYNPVSSLLSTAYPLLHLSPEIAHHCPYLLHVLFLYLFKFIFNTMSSINTTEMYMGNPIR